jgi:hypothetical protein
MMITKTDLFWFAIVAFWVVSIVTLLGVFLFIIEDYV